MWKFEEVKFRDCRTRLREITMMFIGTDVSELKNLAGFILRGSLGLTTAS